MSSAKWRPFCHGLNVLNLMTKTYQHIVAFNQELVYLATPFAREPDIFISRCIVIMDQINMYISRAYGHTLYLYLNDVLQSCGFVTFSHIVH